MQSESHKELDMSEGLSAELSSCEKDLWPISLECSLPGSLEKKFAELCLTTGFHSRQSNGKCFRHGKNKCQGPCLQNLSIGKMKCNHVKSSLIIQELDDDMSQQSMTAQGTDLMNQWISRAHGLGTKPSAFHALKSLLLTKPL